MFTLEDVMREMRKAVKLKGADYVYEKVPLSQEEVGNDAGCAYGDLDGNPSCLVGYVIYALDKEAFNLIHEREADVGESFPVLDAVATLDRQVGSNSFSEDAIDALCRAQLRQDQGEPWGDALAVAENLGADAD